MIKAITAALAGMFGGTTQQRKASAEPVKPSKVKRVSKRAGTSAGMPKYYGFRKQPVLVDMPDGNVKLMSLKNAEKKGLNIRSVLGLADKIKLN